MTFEEAVKALREGRKVKYKDWRDSKYLERDSLDQLHIVSCFDYYPFIPELHELEGEWEIYED